MNKSDQNLIKDYLDGDNEAFSELVGRYLKPIYGFIFRITGNQKDSEDITQEIFFKVWRNLKKYNPNENFKTWIFSIAKNASIDLLRKKKSLTFSDFENENDENALINTLVDPKFSSEKLSSDIENKKLANEILKKLPPSYREIFLLRYVYDMTFEEIGKVLKKPLHTVKSRHRRAVLFIKKFFNAPK